MARYLIGDKGALNAEEMTLNDWYRRVRGYFSEIYHDIRLRFLFMASSQHAKTLDMDSYWATPVSWRVTIFRGGYKEVSIEIVSDD